MRYFLRGLCFLDPYGGAKGTLGSANWRKYEWGTLISGLTLLLVLPVAAIFSLGFVAGRYL